MIDYDSFKHKQNALSQSPKMCIKESERIKKYMEAGFSNFNIELQLCIIYY